MGKTYKDLKKDGKVTLDAPKTKERKRFAPATKTEKPKKGKGSFKREKVADEDEEIPQKKKSNYAKGEKSESKKRDLDNFRKGGGTSFKPNEKAIKESILKFVDAIMDNNHAKAHRHLKQSINKKLQEKIKNEINTPLFAK